MDLRKSNLYHPIPKTDYLGSRIRDWRSKSKMIEPVLIWKLRTKTEMKKSQKVAGYFIIIAIIVIAIITFVSSL